MSEIKKIISVKIFLLTLASLSSNDIAVFKTYAANIKWKLIESLVLIVICALNCVPVMLARKRLFTGEFLSQFSGAAEKETGKQPDKNGYLDMGDGRYGKGQSLPD